MIIQTAVEAEVDAFLGRARYQRAAAVTAEGSNDEESTVRPGYRNGHCPTTVKTTGGPITIARPKLRGIAGSLRASADSTRSLCPAYARHRL
ncbi:hypothetical protein FE391_10615 [Nonomuraea sp. KC401]|uniref:hypothetical protein n=1 Tax=Nonomuraea sp. KC401 TaxID=1848324 RepID=UPI0010FE3F57|nr:MULTISPECIES: hypothetical protein [unclassified Nonomuraea]NBE93227.1 hypothetical protein [Nonomuraea sp. K271]TLF78029.1 hypothetical protein FE391_10615 [Nonomuraea sp. KC401]